MEKRGKQCQSLLQSVMYDMLLMSQPSELSCTQNLKNGKANRHPSSPFILPAQISWSVVPASAARPRQSGAAANNDGHAIRMS